ncbi:hypothetical protein SLS63_000398 [Diaporthe eres]|uniref:Uncharacterized protein n=1 Tax=Diaporthe eres TaxID=83184 RepID=A0ABR1PRP2_DIAER
MLELTAEAAAPLGPGEDAAFPARAARGGGRSVIQLFLHVMPFWRLLVYASDTRGNEDQLQNRLRDQAAPIACLGRDDFKIATYDIIWKALLGSDVDAVRSEREVVLKWAHAIDQPESVQGRAGRDGRSTHARGVRGRTCFIDLLMSPIPGVLHFLLSLTPRTMLTGPTIDDVFDELFLLLVSSSKQSPTIRCGRTSRHCSRPCPFEAILAANTPYLDASIEGLLHKSNVISEVVHEAACDAGLLVPPVPKGATPVRTTYVGHKPFAVPD